MICSLLVFAILLKSSPGKAIYNLMTRIDKSLNPIIQNISISDMY